jgi:hypothetical protein
MEGISKKTIITLIALAVGLLHFITGENYPGPFPMFVNGYLIDILLPMTLVLLLGLVPVQLVQAPLMRMRIVFLFGCIVETFQYMGFSFLGSTFDPLDILAYFAGAILGQVLDRVIFPRLFPRWNEAAG